MKNIFEIRLMRLSLFLLFLILCLSLFAGCGETNADSNNMTNASEIADSGKTEDGYSYEILDNNNVSLTKYEGTEMEIMVPSLVNGKTVTELDSVFEFNSSIISVNIPESVTKIGDFAFSNCSSLANINFSDNVTEIGFSAFSNCTNLTSIALPESIKIINPFAFSNCEKLISITFPEGLTDIGNSAFSDCISLSNITLHSNIKKIDEDAFTNTLWLNNKTEEFVIENGILIDINLPEDIHDVTIPDNVKIIATRMPYDQLYNVTFPAELTDCGYFVAGEGKLKSITVIDNNTVYSSIDGVLYNKDKTSLVCYPQGKENESFTIPDGVSKIETDNWQNIYLKEIVIPESFETDTLKIIEDMKKKCPDLVMPDKLTEEQLYNFTDMSFGFMFLNLYHLETIKFKIARPYYAKKMENIISKRYEISNVIWGYTEEN